ncbi:MAG: cell division protein FtsA [Rhodospirillaceae bacterium]|nr:cell division protein FtsA [Rhodospirillaceae bacterium]
MAVEAAEKMAGTQIEGVFINVACGNPSSTDLEMDLKISGHQVKDTDVKHLTDHAVEHCDFSERELIHFMPTNYSLDGLNGIIDPRGMFGNTLGINIHLITAEKRPNQNLSNAVERCDLSITGKVVSAYASGISCLADDEKELGVIIIDMGAGTTSIAIFQNGHIKYNHIIPVGGEHVTNDIAKGLATPIHRAERLKTMYGSVVPTNSDGGEILRVPIIGEEDDNSVNEIPKSMLVQIIQPRLEETFELVRECVNHSSYGKVVGRRVVLTGGASQLEGVRDLAELVLDKKVRLSRPKPILGVPESLSGPAFSTATGLLRYAVNDHVTRPSHSKNSNKASKYKLHNIKDWFRKNF